MCPAGELPSARGRYDRIDVRQAGQGGADDAAITESAAVGGGEAPGALDVLLQLQPPAGQVGG